MIWFKTYQLEDINRMCRETMVSHLDIRFTEIGEDFIKAEMPVDKRTIQPIGLLHGGASAALAETIGSVASFLCVDPDLFYSVGLEINCNHLKGMTKGAVFGSGRPLHIGRRTHVWEIRIEDEKGNLVAVSRLTLAVIKKE